MVYYLLNMRQSAIFHVVITTILLVAVAVMVFYNLSYDLIFYTVLAGQAWWLLTVYKVLTDDYSTDKTFDDWYEDHPVGRD
ncbi:hypothetical protein SAMN04488034_101120 [Salinimicrobium catena]|uniref:Uncharacterized protein n=2 Tax=Salinimicrobium catena TaxID=390640 RepID=A0A1H5HD05_9FLAO|nr:hypothetical protein SAMN04488140_101120 [Salinimicrobium catena]SEE25148.1 hypothetical protein SAMN04488034_101120 [Salinimicrobium catena]